MSLIVGVLPEAIALLYAGTYGWLKKRFGWPIALLGILLFPTGAIVAVIVVLVLVM